MAARHSPYWARRAKLLLAHTLARVPGVKDVTVLVASAEQFWHAGRWSESLAAYDRAIDEARRSQSPAEAFQLALAAASIEEARGTPARAIERYRQAALSAADVSDAPRAHLHAAWLAAKHTNAKSVEYGPAPERARRAMAQCGVGRRRAIVAGPLARVEGRNPRRSAGVSRNWQWPRAVRIRRSRVRRLLPAAFTIAGGEQATDGKTRGGGGGLLRVAAESRWCRQFRSLDARAARRSWRRPRFAFNSPTTAARPRLLICGGFSQSRQPTPTWITRPRAACSWPHWRPAAISNRPTTSFNGSLGPIERPYRGCKATWRKSPRELPRATVVRSPPSKSRS